VMIQWAWSYLTYDRGARLITGSDELEGWTDLQAKPQRESEEATSTEPAVPAGKLRA
jgi:hypothetical protein